MYTLRNEIGNVFRTTEEMLPLIAGSIEPGGGYKTVDNEEILEILKACY